MRTHSMMNKIFFSMLLVISLVLACAFSANKATAISLKSNAIVESDALMLSDVFSGLPAQKDRVLGNAPRPGQSMVLNARTLMRIAMALDLQWRPAHSGEYITLTRAATIVSSNLIHQALQNKIDDTMEKEGLSGQYSLALSSPVTDIILPQDRTANVEVKSLHLQHDNNKFNAVLVSPSREDPIQTIQVSGAIHRMITIPVLSETFRKGMIISKRDVETITVREDEIQHDTALNIQELIGMTPRRMVMSGKPVKLNDLQQPIVVERGEMVTMIFKNGNMELTAKGKALENGAKGDYVRVANASTSRTVEGIVTAQREVMIQQF